MTHSLTIVPIIHRSWYVFQIALLSLQRADVGGFLLLGKHWHDHVNGSDVRGVIGYHHKK